MKGLFNSTGHTRRPSRKIIIIYRLVERDRDREMGERETEEREGEVRL